MIKYDNRRFNKFVASTLACCIFALSANSQTELFIPNEQDETGSFKVTVGSAFTAANPGGDKRSPNKPSSRYTALNEDVAEALKIIEKNHVRTPNISSERLVSSAIDSMLHSLDPHSNYYTPDEFAELIGEHQNEYFGTGATIINAQVNGVRETFIVAVAQGSPASLAGLRYGDRIISVNGTSVTGLSSATVREMIRGKLGTTVNVELERAGTSITQTIIVKRGRIAQKTVPYSFMLENGVGYVDMTIGFSHSTSIELIKAVNDLKIKGMSSMILDLRGNSGGLVDQAAAVAEVFLGDSLLIVSQNGRTPLDERIWRSRNKRPEDMPLIVLVDKETASAAEIVAGALQDNDRALIIGERTFGKGLVQNVLQLSNGGGITLTAARYYTPSGRLIQREYSNVSLYDYYSQTNRASLLGGSALATRTLTNRTVYGGDGITPDVEFIKGELTDQQLAIFDLSLLFVRSMLKNDSQEQINAIRQDQIFGKNTVNNEMLEKFKAFAAAKIGTDKAEELMANELGLVSSRLRFDLALAAFGTDIAAKEQIKDEKMVGIANEQFARAAQLKESAKFVIARKRNKEKSSLNNTFNELK